MAAVLCLVFLPLMMAFVGFVAAGTTSAALVFLCLGMFVFVLAFQMSRIWDAEEG